MHNKNIKEVLIFNNLYDFVCLWHKQTKKFPKSDRYTLGEKISSQLLDALILIHQARFEKKFKKIETLEKASVSFDSVKILIRMTHTLEIIEQKSYIKLENDLQNIGRMLGGWIRSLKNQKDKTSQTKTILH